MAGKLLRARCWGLQPDAANTAAVGRFASPAACLTPRLLRPRACPPSLCSCPTEPGCIFQFFDTGSTDPFEQFATAIGDGCLAEGMTISNPLGPAFSAARYGPLNCSDPNANGPLAYIGQPEVSTDEFGVILVPNDMCSIDWEQSG